MSFPHSSGDFVRALKAPANPPTPGGPTKIVIARRVWDDSSFHVPSKSEVIVDWILNKIFKEKHNEPPQNPLLNPQYWTLLYDILSSADVSTPGITTRSLKIWLPTLLNRIAMTPILTRFLNLLDKLELDIQNQLSGIFSSCFRIMWPLAVRKISTEALLECFGALLNSWSLCERNVGIGLVGEMVVSSYRSSLWYSSNKKKIYLHFLQTHLYLWLTHSTVVAQSNSHQLLLEVLYEAGIDTILNVDIIRQTRDSKSENTLLFETIAIALSSNPMILATLPRIFASYIQVVKQHRSSLYGHGSNQSPGVVTDEANACGMRFFVACDDLLDHIGSNTTTWSTRVQLLSLLDQENIFSRGQPDVPIMNRIVELAINALEEAPSGRARNIEFHTYAIESLSALVRIDYNIVLPALPRILSAILMHESGPAYQTFLDSLLAYHSKTRTINAYITNLFSAFSSEREFAALGSAPVVYQRCHSGPLLDVHLNFLSKAIRGFLSDAQAHSMVNLVATSLGRALEQLQITKEVSDDKNELQKKRQPTGDSSSASQLDYLAVSASLSIRLSTIIISSLPLGSAPDHIRQEILQILSNIRNMLLPRALTRTLKRIRRAEEATTWRFQVTATALLRFRYVLVTSRDLPLEPSDDLKLLSTTQTMIGLDKLVPELRVEIFRILLGSSDSRDLTETRVVVGHIITYLAENMQALDVYGLGNPHQSSFSMEGSFPVLLHTMVERWLPILESIATPVQLKSFFQHITHFRSQESQTVKASETKSTSLFAQVYRSAQFWEHRNIRSALLAHISDTTLALDNINDMSKLLSALPVYRMLLHFPMEYIPRSYRTELIRRTMAADLFITRSWEASDYALTDTLKNLTILRLFLNRIFLHSGFTEQSVQSICELSRCIILGDSAHKEYDIEMSSATKNLNKSLFSELLYRTTVSNLDTVSTVVAFLETIQDTLSKGNDFQSSYITQIIRVLDEKFTLASFPQEIRVFLHGFHGRFSSFTLPKIHKLTNAEISIESLDQQSIVLEMWHALLIFGHWLGLSENPFPNLEKVFLAAIIKKSTTQCPSSEMWDTLLITVLAILLEEIHFVNEVDCFPHLRLIIGSYLAFSGIVTHGRKRLDNNLLKACQALSPPQFSHILHLVREGLNTLSTSEDRLAHLIELSNLLLHNYPQGALKYTQVYAASCLSTFIRQNCFTEGSVWLRVQVLEFVAQRCSDRPMTLKPGDVNNIWTLLTRFLAGSRVHDNETTYCIFHKIVTIIGALVRFRRDLVILTLPHLGVILRQLFMSVRSVRPLLGSQQTTLVTDTLPKWVHSRSPLGAEEGRVLARLLVTLATKSIVRNSITVSEAPKAESLAKSFSKHASYVLKAYIEVMNDPLCILRSDLRKELQQGLYALCSMVSDHSRDAMMLSALDSGGRVTMKILWKEYEKQKYIGKG
ncbi:Urb2/Npa2 family-domain-containing protein [Collybia nuda]|uniref:Urb2/Npa2 family-domain-containing protein n=1 Tax=Collybia nuda TaxID=64659 RepID=A0A9P6CCJ5_9AGAR|nr:Urb2/Npa2 family-domain-containing protein [Collybia nuda]